MPRDGVITFGDLHGKLGALRVACEKCGHSGRYNLGRLIEHRGPDGKVVDLLAEVAVEQPAAFTTDAARAALIYRGFAFSKRRG